MNKERVKGAIDETVGSAKRQLGNLTGNTRTQVEGAAQQLKGKAETTIGKLKDAVRDANDDASAPRKKSGDVEREHRAVTRAENRNLL
jgi:uncharacterized protein YjbJ (UPF0337 family)